MTEIPKPPPREKKKPQPIRRASKWLKRHANVSGRRSRIRDRMPKALGDHRERVKYANELWRRLIYAKAPVVNGVQVCKKCRKPFGLQAAHLFPKGAHPHMRFEVDNGEPLCFQCHRGPHGIDSDHEEKLRFCVQILGEERYEALRLRSISRAKTDVRLEIMSMEFEFQKRGWPFPKGGA